jgi:hypothetical protein
VAEKLLGDVLIKRRDKIARAYLTAINPVMHPAFDGATLTFENAAVRFAGAGAPDGGYQVSWFSYDNATGETRPIGQPSAARDERVAASSDLPSAPGAFLKASIRTLDKAHPDWSQPVDAYFRRDAAGWTLVGLDRTVPENVVPKS